MSSDDLLKHYGVLGMKWGVRRSRAQLAKASGATSKGRVGKVLDSMKRERQWKTVVKKVDKLNTKEITTVAKRIGLENDLKRLSKSSVGGSKDRQDYLRRGKMDNQELSRKVTRLKAKENLTKAVKSASKEQREFGEKVVNIGANIGVKYAVTKSIKPKDILSIAVKPKSNKDLLETVLKKVNEPNK